jgi:tRNA (guanine-N7-)-methyltransferase
MEQALFHNKRWRNPYIDLLETLPNMVVSAGESGLSTSQIEFIKNKLTEFKEVIIELGCGSGTHIVERAKNSKALHIGFELRFKRAFKSAEKANKENLKNLLIIRHDAKAGLNLFNKDSIQGCYVNFPDPWGKEKWIKNRLLSPDTLKKLSELLTLGGFISYKTDHLEAFQYTVDLIENNNAYQLIEVTNDLENSTYQKNNIKTEFERLFLSKKLKINSLKAIKASA